LFYDHTGSIGGLQITNNIFYGNGINSATIPAGITVTNYTSTPNYTSNPLFVSTTDFHLQSGSPARDTGINVGLTNDKDGVAWHNPPSIGAYEYIFKSANIVNSIIENPNIGDEPYIIYPNPVKDKLTIAFKEKDKQVSLKLYDSKGTKLYEEIVTGNIILDMSSYASGLYILHVRIATGELKVAKIIKNDL
jgi:hypothetical protein